MSKTALTTREISIHNLKRRPFRTACLVILVAILAFTLTGGSILIKSLKDGMVNLEKRLGADIMAVPLGYEAGIEGALLRGEPSAFYFEAAIADRILHIDGVSQVSSQFFITSLSEACCSMPVQLIGFEPQTDFVIQPWVVEKLGGNIGNGQLMVGSSIIAQVGGTLKFFGQGYTVAGQLDKTATAFDTSVFMTMDTARKMFKDARKIGYHFFTEGENAISSVMVKIERGAAADAVAKKIRINNPEADIVISKNLISGIVKNLNTLVVYIHTLSAGLWLLALIVLSVIFPVTINERKREYAVLRTLGATRKKLAGIVLSESSWISLTGSIIGIFLSCLLLLPFSTYISIKLKMPYLQPRADVLLYILGVNFLLSFAVGPLTSFYSAIRIGRAEPYITLREGE